jgi:hypothetical protein
MSDWIKSLADRFTLDEKLFSDETGESWRGTESSTGRAVLVRFWTSLPAHRRLLAERLASLEELNHPSLVVPLEAGVKEQGWLLVRYWFEQTASEKIAPLSLDEKLSTIIRVAEALHAAHGVGVIHGQVHAGNVFIDDRGMIQLTDFGFPGVQGAGGEAWQSPQCRAGAAPEPTDDVYSLGVLIYRWLTGDDPGSPLPEVARLQEMRERRDQGLALPPQLARLVASVLSADPGHRPHSMLELREQLEDARLAILRALETGIEETDSDWQPGRVQSQPPRPASDPQSQRISLARVMLPVAGVLVAVALVLVLWILPRQVERDQLALRQEAEATAELKAKVDKARAQREAKAAEKKPPTPAELEALLASKQAAEDQLDEFVELRLELEDRAVDRWGAEQFEAAQALRASGNEPFRRQDFAVAGDIYSQATVQLRAVHALGDMVLAEALERGKQALLRGRAKAAIEAFTLASAIEQDNEWASTGLNRGNSLDQVLALTARADEAELAGDWNKVIEYLKQVQKLDPLTEGVDARIKSARGTIADIAFRTAMSAGLEAIEAGRWAEARKDLEQAQKMRPSDRAPRDALLEVERRFREAGIQHHRDLADESVAAEQWSKALKHFEAVLERDANLRFAQEGQKLASTRADLDQRLVMFIQSPQRWWSDEGRQQAANLLREAGRISVPGSRLNGQIQKLQQQLELARRPVVVTLLSDNACSVVLYKIGRLGQFESHQVRLQPGRYTAVGTRDGYRDVRRDFLVDAQRGVEPVVVRCEEEV